MTDPLIPMAQPRVLLVIGTFAAVPYVHLHLESRRRFYPDVPVIIHDDCSPAADQLRQLCSVYGAEYLSSEERLPPNAGDLRATLCAIQQAYSRKADLAVKISRRFIPLMDWVPSLQETAWQAQAATYSQRDKGSHLGFRTECIAFHAATWIKAAALIEAEIQALETSFQLVEPFLHQIARELYQPSAHCAARQAESVLDSDDGYCPWSWMGDDRTQRNASWIWHQSDSLLDYARLSQAYGLAYQMEDFIDPNMGYGQGYR
jgi:hypothetical protein